MLDNSIIGQQIYAYHNNKFIGIILSAEKIDTKCFFITILDIYCQTKKVHIYGEIRINKNNEYKWYSLETEANYKRFILLKS